MPQLVTTDDWRWGLEQSHFLCLIWSAEPQYAETQRVKLAYAMALGKPIRLVVLPPARLPEDLCAGYADFQVARVGDARQVLTQVQAWMTALAQGETHD